MYPSLPPQQVRLRGRVSRAAVGSGGGGGADEEELEGGLHRHGAVQERGAFIWLGRLVDKFPTQGCEGT